jgi:hypothetical protein
VANLSDLFKELGLGIKGLYLNAIPLAIQNGLAQGAPIINIDPRLGALIEIITETVNARLGDEAYEGPY